MIWGVDLGVRSFHAAGIDEDGELTLHKEVLPTPKSVAKQAPEARARELAHLASSLSWVVHNGGHVFLEEPPMVKDRRVFLKLAQVSGALAVAAGRPGVSLAYVPVDTWKMTVCGKGGLSKEQVADVLSASHSSYAAKCRDDQNFVDAVCIALYGQQALTRGAHELDAGLGPTGPTRRPRGPRSRAVGQRTP